MIVKFKFDKEKDLKNIWETANCKRDYGYDFRKNLTKNILEICSNKEYKKCHRKLQKTMHTIHENILMKEIAKSVSSSWNKIEKEYFKRLEKITKNKFHFKKINAYLTSAGRCPYNPSPKNPSFHFSLFSGILFEMNTIGHELMHIHLHNSLWWKKVEKEIGRNKTHDLKEALTELLNLEFQDLWIIKDKGYPNHTQLRKYISQQWKKKKDFKLLTEKCIKWIKKKGVK